MHRVSPSAATLKIVYPITDDAGIGLSIDGGSLTATMYKNGVSYKTAFFTSHSSTTFIGVSEFNGLELAVGDQLTVLASWTVPVSISRKKIVWSGWVDNPPPTAEEIANTLATAHGAGSWEGGVGAAGGGPNPFTVTVQDDSGNPKAGVKVYILTATGNPTGWWLPTDAEGTCVFGLVAGDYQYAAGTLAGYSTPAPADQTIVNGNAAEKTIVLTAQISNAPDAAGLCVIDDYVLDASKAAVSGATVTAVASEAAVLVDAGILSQVKAKATTDINGRFQLQLVRADAMTAGQNYTIEIRHNAKGIYRSITGPVPNAVSATLKQIEAGA